MISSINRGRFANALDGGGVAERFKAQVSSRTKRRGAGVVERGGPENRCARKGTVSSNLTPAALNGILDLVIPVLPETKSEKTCWGAIPS